MTMTDPRDPSTLTDDDLPSMSEEEAALYYEANAHRLDELFDTGQSALFEPAQNVSLVVSVRMKQEEAELLAQAARAAGTKLSTYLREAGIAAAGRAQDAEAVSDDALPPGISDMRLGDLAEALKTQKSGTHRGRSRGASSRGFRFPTNNLTVRYLAVKPSKPRRVAGSSPRDRGDATFTTSR